jgi:hypothetical protein
MALAIIRSARAHGVMGSARVIDGELCHVYFTRQRLAAPSSAPRMP